MQAARERVEAFAFSGQVPVNVTGASPGDYIVPTCAANDNVLWTAVPAGSISFEQYRKAVGKVWKVLPDGRASVAVKIG